MSLFHTHCIGICIAVERPMYDIGLHLHWAMLHLTLKRTQFINCFSAYNKEWNEKKKQLYIIIITTNKHTYNVWNECFFAFLAQCRRDCFNAANFFMYAERAWNEMDLAFVCKIVKQTRNILPLFQFFLLVIQWFVTQQMEIMSSEFKQSASTGMLHKLTIWFSCK